METGNIYVTAQNHGYAVDPAGLPNDVVVSHINLNDETVEGLTPTRLPVLTIQYHSEASPGPHDSEYLFDRFLEKVKERAHSQQRRLQNSLSQRERVGARENRELGVGP